MLCSLAYSWVFPAGEPGIFYEDLYDLVKPLHGVSHLLLPWVSFLTH